MLSSSSLRDNWGLLIDVRCVFEDCYFVTLLHVTCYIKRFAIRENGEKKLRVCQNSLILKKSQSPDFHKPGLCYV